jgi:hypothetical protein
MLFGEIIAVYSEIQMNIINTLRGQNAELQGVKENGTYSYHCAKKDRSEPLYSITFVAT